MTDAVKSRPKRRYHAPQRAEQAAATRRAVLEAARELFTTHGYAGTTIGQIAERAGVAVDTLYATVGRKPVLLREVFETALSGRTSRCPRRSGTTCGPSGARRTPARRSRSTPRRSSGSPRLAPVQLALRDAAVRDPACAALHAEMADRRAGNMRLFAADLRATGELRADLSNEDVGDIVWSMTSAEYYVLLVQQRGWATERFGEHLRDAWTRLLLAAP